MESRESEKTADEEVKTLKILVYRKIGSLYTVFCRAVANLDSPHFSMDSCERSHSNQVVLSRSAVIPFPS